MTRCTAMNSETTCQNQHQQVQGCALCKLEDASEALRHSDMALRSQGGAFDVFIAAAEKLRAVFEGLTPAQCAAIPDALTDAWSDFDDAIPCRDCHAAPCGCPNV